MEKSFLSAILEITDSFKLADLDLPTCVLQLSKLFKDYGYLQSVYILDAAEELITQRLNELPTEHLQTLFSMISKPIDQNDPFNYDDGIRKEINKSLF